MRHLSYWRSDRRLPQALPWLRVLRHAPGGVLADLMCVVAEDAT